MWWVPLPFLYLCQSMKNGKTEWNVTHPFPCLDFYWLLFKWFTVCPNLHVSIKNSKKNFKIKIRQQSLYFSICTIKINCQVWAGFNKPFPMSHFSYACKMRCPLNLVLESWEYLWFYLTFWIAILDCGLKLHKLSIHTLVMLQKWLEIY